MTSFDNFQFVLTMWSACVEPHLEGRKEASKYFLNVCYLPDTVLRVFITLLFYFILRLLYEVNTIPPFSFYCFKQVRGLKRQRGKDICPKSHNLIVIFDSGLTAKLIFFLLKNVAGT